MGGKICTQKFNVSLLIKPECIPFLQSPILQNSTIFHWKLVSNFFCVE
nr:MAG TPA: hypothetical protein [Caudoviricetes sp.]